MILTTAAVGLAAWGLALLAAGRRHRSTRPMGLLASRRLRPKDDNVGTARDYACTTAMLRLADAMTPRWRRARGRREALAGSLTHLRLRVEQAESNLDRAAARLGAADAEADGQRPPALWGRLFLIALYVGDMTVITMAIQAESASNTLAQALLAAMSLGTALFIFGKLGGHLVKDRLARDSSRGRLVAAFLVGLAAVVSAFGVSLMMLRVGSLWAWLLLSVAPALGSAAVTILGPTAEQREVARRSRQVPRLQARLVRAQQAADRVHSAVRRLDEQSEAEIRRSALLAESEMKRLGISESMGSGYIMTALANCNRWVPAIHGNLSEAGPASAGRGEAADASDDAAGPVPADRPVATEAQSDNGAGPIHTVGAFR